MSNWRTGRLGDVLTLQRGFDLPARARRPGIVPVVSSSGITGSHDEAKVQGPGVVIGRYGTLGEVHFVSVDYWPLNTSLYVKDFKGNDPRYCAYLLKTVAATSSSTAAAVPGVNRNVLHELPVRYPDVQTQRRISSVLGAYDDLVELNKRRIEVLNEMSQLLFNEWFIRFRFPGYECCTIIKTRGGTRPEGWKRGELGDLINLSYGRALKADVRTSENIPVIGSSGVVGWHNVALVKGPGIVIGRKGNVGAVIWSACDFFPIDTVFFVQSSNPIRFLLHQLQRINFLNNDSAVPGLNRIAALRHPINIPPRDLMTRYDETVAPMLDLAERLCKANTSLLASRDLILPRLISGEVSISNVKRELEAVA